MTVVDAVVVIVLALALLAGFLRGIVRPLVTWIFVVAGVVVAFFHPGLAAKLAPSSALRPVVGIAVVIGFGIAGMILGRLIAPLIYGRIPLLRTLDRGAGMAISGLMSGISLYMMLSALVSVDSLITPLTRATSVSRVQIAQINDVLKQHPELASLLNPDDVSAAQNQLGTGTVETNQINTVSGSLGVWQQIHNQLAASRVAPAIFGFFDHIPVIGRGRDWPAP